MLTSQELQNIALEFNTTSAYPHANLMEDALLTQFRVT